MASVALAHWPANWETAEEFWCDHVDAHVGALGGEGWIATMEFPWGTVYECAFDFGIGFVEGLENCGYAFGGAVAARGNILGEVFGF